MNDYTKPDRKRTTNLEGKCASCMWFVADERYMTGRCKGPKSWKGPLYRTYKCKNYERGSK